VAAVNVETLPKTTNLPIIRSFRRIVIKVGSSLLIDQDRGCVRKDWLDSLAEDIADLHQQGADVLVVSSGAVALGRTVLRLPRKGLKLEDSQAAAAVGQIALARIWAEVLAERKITAGQILVTFGDTEERQRYLNARATIGRLLDLRAVPVINENDTVATNELRYGDNDRLAARVATMGSADLLIVLSDVPGLYTAPPTENPKAELVPLVTHVDEKIEAMAGGAASQLSRGGMRTKIDAAKIATTGGTHMLIADGRIMHPVARLNEPVPCTWFLSGSNPVTARKKWIAGSLEPRGTLYVDAGAAHAIMNGKSLLPAGVTRVEGNFLSGDCVLIRDARSAEIGRGLIGYDSGEAALIAGRNSQSIVDVLGAPGRAAIIHRDDMVLGSGYVSTKARGENGKR
jgi:glutamate 5-kinase